MSLLKGTQGNLFEGLPIENFAKNMNVEFAKKSVYKVQYFVNGKFFDDETTPHRATAEKWKYNFQQKGQKFSAVVSKVKQLV